MSIKHICISGGAHAGLYGIGALNHLFKMNYIQYEDIHSLYGTSIGSVLCLLIALQYQWDDIIYYVSKRPWYKLIHISSVFQLYDKKGIMDKDLFYAFFEPLFKMKDISLHMTMKECYERTKKELYIFATDVSTMEYVEFSHIQHPDLKVIEAVYMSSSLPMIFKPLWYNNTYYIDGVIHISDPSSICASRNKDDTENILSILFRKNNPIVFTEDMNIMEYTSMIMSNILKLANNQTNTLKSSFRKHVMYIPYNNISFDEFSSLLYDESLRNLYIKQGIDYAKAYMNYQENQEHLSLEEYIKCKEGEKKKMKKRRT